MTVTIIHSKFEIVENHLIEITRTPCNNCLKDVGNMALEVYEVIIVGGMSRVPRVEEIDFLERSRGIN
jgi:molecular chaperone DnaK